MTFVEALRLSRDAARGEEKGPAFARPMEIVGTEWCRWQAGWTYRLQVEDLLADDWAFFEPVRFERPTMTPLGNMHDLLAYVACGSHGECDPE